MANKAQQRRLTGAFFQSLDTVVQGGGGPEEDPSGSFKFGGWCVPYTDESSGPATNKWLIEPDYDLLLAKRTYDIFAGYWPKHTDNPVGAKFEAINKYVLTHSDAPLSWTGSHKLTGDTAEVVKTLKASPGRDLLIQGSTTLYRPLLAAGLIDRLVVMTFPVLLGQGKRIIDPSVSPGALKLVDHFVSDSGVVFATYEPDGMVQTGAF
jgi:dihydrofolate reductase